MISFADHICLFFKDKVGLDLNKYRTDETRNFDSDSLLFVNWDLMSNHIQKKINRFAEKYKESFNITEVKPGLKCIAEVKENRL